MAEIVEAAQAVLWASLAVVGIALAFVVVCGTIIGLAKVAGAWLEEWRANR